MKKTLILLLALWMPLVSGCSTGSQTGGSGTQKQETIKLKEYTMDEIYCDVRYENDYFSPVLQYMQVYPADDMAYVYAGSAVSDMNPCWHTIYTKEDGMPSVLHDPFCYDPLCSHDDITCLAYSTKGSGTIIPLGDRVYLKALGMVRESRFIEYSLSSGKYETIGTYEIGGNVITRMGRFVYFSEQVVTGQDETGKQEDYRVLYRYDLETGKTDCLGDRSSDWYYGEPTPYNGEIYYNYANQLYKCDYNFRYNRKLLSSYKIKIFEIRDDEVWFLTETGEKSGELYRADLSGGEAELLYENVTWFAMDGDTLYYSLYDPMEAFEWDIWRETKDGSGKMLVSQMISINNGNRIYRISLDKAGKKGKAAPFCEMLAENDLYLSETYAVYDGLLITNFRGSYSEGSKKGLLSGKAVIDMDTGEIVRITSEGFINDKVTYPYVEG